MKYLDPIELLTKQLNKILSQPKGKIIAKNLEKHRKEIIEYGNAIDLLVKVEVNKKRKVLDWFKTNRNSL